MPSLILSAGVLANACKADNVVSQNKKSVIVVGAGISGLAAAKKLHENGFKVTVYEANNKIGGRLSTNRSISGIAFDEGASWIHGVEGNPITSLAKQAGMTTSFTDDTNIIVYDIGSKPIDSGVYASTEDAFFNVLATLHTQGDASKSFEAVFQSLYPNQAKDRLWKFFLSSFVTFDLGDLDKLSSILYQEGEEFGGDEHNATNGYDTIAKFLSLGLDIRLSSRVTKIDYSEDKVKLWVNGTENEADYVLITVPLGVLKGDKINFEPALPFTKQNAIQKVGMGCVNKFLLTWDEVFWDNRQYIAYTPEQRDKFNYFVNLHTLNPNAKALMTFAYAEYARKTETMNDAELVNEIMKHLKDIYGSNIPNPTNLLRTRWQSNENTFGSYSFTAVGTEMQHFNDLAAEIGNKVFFAGEHTHIDYYSTAHGAYLSGIREADKILAL